MATAIVVGLGAMVVVLLQDDLAPTPTTSVSTTTTTSSPTTASSTATTSTTTADQRLAEVETILQELWFGWFDAIYRKDADALWEVVATTTGHESGLLAMESMEFVAAPSLEEVKVFEVDVLLDRGDCLVVQNAVDLTGILGIVGDTTVNVLWPDPRYGWRFATDWSSASDRWLDDCDVVIRETTP
jgi:hypothetical protein